MAIKNPVTKSAAEGYVKALKDPEQGGFTHPNVSTGEDPTSSHFMVSIKGREEHVPLASITSSDILSYSKRHKEDLLHKSQFLGGWSWEDDEGTKAPVQKAALDISRGVPFKGPNKDPLAYSEAMRQAAINKQRAIYDPRPNAVSRFPANPHFNSIPSEAHNRSEWDYKWLTGNATSGILESGHWAGDED